MAARVTGLGALVLFSSRLHETVAFYRALGVALEEEHHDEGPRHFACEAGTTHVAVYDAQPGHTPGHHAGGSTFPGFVVDSVADSLAAARSLSPSVRQEPERYPWGLRCVLDDPDGRTIEIYERA